MYLWSNWVVTNQNVINFNFDPAVIRIYCQMLSIEQSANLQFKFNDGVV